MRQFRGNSPVTQSGCLQDVQPGPSLDLSWTVAPPRCRAPCGRTEMRSANTSVRIYTHCACTMRLPCPMVMRTCSIACATHKQSSMGTGKGPAHTHTSQSDTIRLYAFLQDRYGFFVLNMATHSTHTPHTTSPHTNRHACGLMTTTPLHAPIHWAAAASGRRQHGASLRSR